MKTPLDEVLNLTQAMLTAARANDWPHFEHLHERRASLLKPGLYSHADAPRLLPKLDAVEKQLAAIFRDDTLALNETSELLGPICGTQSDATSAPRTRQLVADTTA